MSSHLPPLRRVISAVMLMLASALGSVGDSIAQGTTFTFQFNPPDGVTFTEKLKKTRVRDRGGEGKETVQGEVVGRVVINRSADGYRMTCTVISAKATRDGKPALDLDSLLVGTATTYELDENGRVVAVSGHEELPKQVLERLTKELGPEGAAKAFQAVSSILKKETIENKMKAEWHGRVACLAGYTENIGDVVASSNDFPLPSGDKITFYTTTKFARWVQVAGHECVELEFDYNTDAKAVAALIGQTLEDFRKTLGTAVPVPGFSGVTITGRGRRIVDPMTLLIYGEKTTRTITMKMDQPGQGQDTIRQTETREYSYDYGEAEEEAVDREPAPAAEQPGTS